MIKNFEEITHELTDKELDLVPIVMMGFKCHNEHNPIKAPSIVERTNRYLENKGIPMKLTQPRLRKIVNYIRTNGLQPLIATSKGYFTTYDPEIIAGQVLSLEQRARSINQSAEGLKKYLP